jgi:hypothetical protein
LVEPGIKTRHSSPTRIMKGKINNRIDPRLCFPGFDDETWMADTVELTKIDDSDAAISQGSNDPMTDSILFSDSTSSDIEKGKNQVESSDNKQAPRTSEDSPEELVRSDNQAITLVRSLVLLVLLAAAGATVSFVYTYASRSEMKSFKSEYDAVANTLKTSLYLDLQLNLWMAKTVASIVSTATEATGMPVTNLTISDKRWEEMTQEARLIGDAAVASWIPFLYNDHERLLYEAYMRDSVENAESNENPDCYFCNENPDLVFQNEQAEVELTGVGVYTCGEIFRAGRTGIIPKDSCHIVQSSVEPICRCIEPHGSDAALWQSWAVDGNKTEGDNVIPWEVEKGIFRFLDVDNETIAMSQEYGTAPYAPVASVSATRRKPILYNYFSDPRRAKSLGAVMFGRVAMLSEMTIRRSAYDRYAMPGHLGDAISEIYFPVFDPKGAEANLLGAVVTELRWKEMLTGAVSVSADLVDVVIRNSCGQVLSFKVNSEAGNLMFQGEGDLHDTRYDGWRRHTTYDEYELLIEVLTNGHRDENSTNPIYCSYMFEVYPTRAMEDFYLTSMPIIFTAISVVIFIFTSVVFYIYDVFVRRRQHKVMASAKRSNEIVTSLFPENVRRRMYKHVSSPEFTSHVVLQNNNVNEEGVAANKMPSMTSDSIFGSEPIADLFPHATVMFIDIAGFTAWSSERNATQVFTLLEVLYHSFDEVARELGIFKVETIGDSYVAVAGLPTPRNDHAVGKTKIHRCPLLFYF